jgi:hypothetical protein
MCRPATGPGRPCTGCFGAGSVTAPGSRSSPPAGPGRRQGRDHLGGQRGLHGGQGASARRRGPQRGDRQREEPGGVDNEPADHALGRSRGGLSSKLHWPSRVANAPCRSWSPPASAATAPSSGRCWAASGCHALAWGGPARDRTGCWLTRPTAPGPTGRCCVAVASGPPSRRRMTRRPTGGPGVAGVAGRRPSTRRLQAAPCGGVWGQPAQATPGGGHPL